MEKQRCAAHLAFVRQPLGTCVTLAGFSGVKIRQLDHYDLRGKLRVF